MACRSRSALVAAGVNAAFCALLFGAFCVRSTKIYFSMLTLAFAQIVWAVCFKWNSVTGGEQGLNNVPYPDLDWMAMIPALGEPARRRQVLSAGAAAHRHRVRAALARHRPRRSAAC